LSLNLSEKSGCVLANWLPCNPRLLITINTSVDR
jgi:hypothetical protein